MHWYRQDVDEDFDPKIMVLSRKYPLSGVGFWRTLRNQVYRAWPKPFVLDDLQWESLRAVMHISRKRFDEMLEVCMKLGLFSEESFRNFSIVTSPRIEKEIKDMVVHRERNRTISDYETPAEKGAEKGSETQQKPYTVPNRTLPYPTEPDQTDTTHPLTPARLAGAAYSSFQVIVSNRITLKNGDRVEAERACQVYPEEWITAAVGEACKSNRLNWPYVAAILKRWERENGGKA